MKIELIRAGEGDAERIWQMQVEAFSGLYEKYQDTETSPATEPMDRIAARLAQPFTYFYMIQADGETVGAIRVVDKKEPGASKRISPIFVMPAFRNRGIAQAAIREVERLHGRENWELDTILQEAGNCHLYEKMGYRRMGKTTVINERMTLVFDRKD